MLSSKMNYGRLLVLLLVGIFFFLVMLELSLWSWGERVAYALAAQMIIYWRHKT